MRLGGESFKAAENYLAHFPPQRRGAILLGALASVYSKDEGGADTAAWLAGTKDEQGLLSISIAHQTIAVLRGMGLLNDLLFDFVTNFRDRMAAYL